MRYMFESLFITVPWLIGVTTMLYFFVQHCGNGYLAVWTKKKDIFM